MTHEELLLLTELKRVCDKAGPFSHGFPDNGLPIAAETAYAEQLIELGQGILRHAKSRELLVIDAEVVGLGDATATRKQQLAIEHRASTHPDATHDVDQPPSPGQVVLGDPDCPEG